MGKPDFARIPALDGLRGVAAIVVLIDHVMLAFWPSDQNERTAWTGIFRDGSLAVGIFFVHSGFVLSLPFLRSRSNLVLASAASRRYFRLAIPVMASVLAVWAAMSAGLYRNQSCLPWVAKFNAFGPSLTGAAKQGLWYAYTRTIAPEDSYNAVLWTMEAEFKGSLFIFAFLGIAACLRNRWLVYVITATVCWRLQGFYFAEFLAGAALADVFTSREIKLTGWPGILAATAFAAGLVIGGPGKFINPQLHSLARSLGSLLVVGGVVYSSQLQSALDRLVYLGRISFPLYLFHLPAICTLGCWVFVETGSAGYAALVSVALSLGLAIIGAVTIEPWSIMFGHVAYNRLLAPTLR